MAYQRPHHGPGACRGMSGGQWAVVRGCAGRGKGQLWCVVGPIRSEMGHFTSKMGARRPNLVYHDPLTQCGWQLWTTFGLWRRAMAWKHGCGPDSVPWKAHFGPDTVILGSKTGSKSSISAPHRPGDLDKCCRWTPVGTLGNVAGGRGGSRGCLQDLWVLLPVHGTGLPPFPPRRGPPTPVSGGPTPKGVPRGHPPKIPALGPVENGAGGTRNGPSHHPAPRHGAATRRATHPAQKFSKNFAQVIRGRPPGRKIKIRSTGLR